MNLFIDTNIFLSFYHLTDDDLEELKKIIALIETQKLKLYLPEQVLHEFKRNRDIKISDALKQLRDCSFKLIFPTFSKHYPEYSELKKLQRECEKLHSSLISKINQDISSFSLAADSITTTLFLNALMLKTEPKIIESARLRMDLKNPPGKNGSLGDAINWECLKKHVPVSEDLFIITDDKDYVSALNHDQFNSYLTEEWTKDKKGKIIFYKRLSSFFKDNFPHIELASEVEKEVTIEGLAASPSFSYTHSYIAKLSKYTSFTASQINDIVKAAISNRQIWWIIDDDDVHSFFTNLIKGKENLVDPENLSILKDLMEKEDPDDDDWDF